MHFICLTPTYGRPSLVANALALFLDQQLPAGDTAYLAILDDAEQITPQAGRRGPLSWEVFAHPLWIPLPRKYAAILSRLGGIVPHGDTVYVVWDDDDVYLPWHLSAIGNAFRRRPPARWAHPSSVFSTYDDRQPRLIPWKERPRLERAAGRFHGALAVRGDLLAELDGWPDTDLATYDQQILAACSRAVGVDPCTLAPVTDHRSPITDHVPREWIAAAPSYCYRWGDTGKWHASGTIDEGVYRQPPVQEPGSVEIVRADYDASTVRILQWLTNGAGGEHLHLRREEPVSAQAGQ